MRGSYYGLAALVLLGSPLVALADDAAAAKEVLDKAVAAVGGREKAAALGDVTLKGKGQSVENGKVEQFNFDLSVKDFFKSRLDLTMTENGQAHVATLVINEGQMWVHDSSQNMTMDAPGEVKTAIETFLLAIAVPSNPLGIAKIKDVELTHGGEAKIGDATAWIIRVSRKDHPDLTIYFDQKSGLPLKSETLIKEPFGKEKEFGFQFSEFKEKDGVKHFTKIKIERDGNTLTEIELTEFKSGAKNEASTFEKP